MEQPPFKTYESPTEIAYSAEDKKKSETTTAEVRIFKKQSKKETAPKEPPSEHTPSKH
jgi:hypothetical protein